MASRLTVVVSILGAAALHAQTNVVTYHNDSARTGQYLNELLLTPENVKAGSFQRRYVFSLDGAVYAQPLYLSRVKIAGKGFHNVLFVPTSHDSLYALDADDESSSTPLWKVNFLDSAAGVTTVSASDVNCPVIPELGISGTPVIDPDAGIIYLIALTKESGDQYVYRLHALDVTSGAEKSGSPAVIQAPGFVPFLHKQRTGLLLLNGTIYSSWSGHCDHGTYHGWVMAHDAATLQMTGYLNDSPGVSGASFWNAGAGPAADEDGNIFVVSANGDFSGSVSLAQYDESVLRITPAPQIAVSQQFTPYNKVFLDQQDLDLGSSGALVLPDEAGSSEHPHVLFTSGKEGRMYLLNRDALGGAQVDSDLAALASVPVPGADGTFGSAAYFNGLVYVSPSNSPTMAFPVSGASLGSMPAAATSNQNGTLGATPSISANGTKDGIAWIITNVDGGQLLAYDANDLSELYNSGSGASSQLPGYAEFTVPTVADGKVFAPTDGGLAIYGESSPHAPALKAVTNAASYSPSQISPGSLITIFGSGLSAITANASSVPLPVSIADTSVTVNGIPAPLLFESATQINAQLPWEIPVGSATVAVRTRGASSSPMNITVQAAAPGVFTDEGGNAAALDADGSVNSNTHPAAAGSTISVFFTGQGAVTRAIDDGAAPVAGQVDSAVSNVSVTIGGSQAQIEFAGLAPLYPGLAQINLKVPPLASGTYPLTVLIAGRASNVAQLAISGLE